MSHATSPTPTRPEAGTRLRRVVVTAGLHGSASTWVFNVVRELMEARYGAACVAAPYAESPAAAIGQAGSADCVIWKTHWGGEGFFDFVAASRADLLVSIRDPRDALLSTAERFGEPAERLLPALVRDCAFALACAQGGARVFRYEDRFFDRPASINATADHLRVDAHTSLQGRIFGAWHTDAVRTFAARLRELPEGRWIDQGPAGGVDLLTQVHQGHIGDTLSGKWRQRLDPALARTLTLQTFDFILHFGYPAW